MPYDLCLNADAVAILRNDSGAVMAVQTHTLAGTVMNAVWSAACSLRLTAAQPKVHKWAMKKNPIRSPDDFADCACSGMNLPKLVQPSIMAALLKGPLHGYALAQQIARESAPLSVPPDHSGIYRLLRSMEKSGLLTSELAESEAGPARREYSLTTRGRLCLKSWMAALSRYREMIEAVLRLGRT